MPLIYDVPEAYVTVTGTTLTLSNSTHNSRTVEFTSSSSVTVTVPNSLPKGFSCVLLRAGTGAVTVVAGSGATMRNADSHTRVRSQWSQASIDVRANGTGTAAEFIFGGDTAP